VTGTREDVIVENGFPIAEDAELNTAEGTVLLTGPARAVVGMGTGVEVGTGTGVEAGMFTGVKVEETVGVEGGLEGVTWEIPDTAFEDGFGVGVSLVNAVPADRGVMEVGEAATGTAAQLCSTNETARAIEI
jgi:hypothetical protein